MKGAVNCRVMLYSQGTINLEYFSKHFHSSGVSVYEKQINYLH